MYREKSMLLRFVILLSILISIVAEGTWYCEPCKNPSCELTNPNKYIRYYGGRVQCGEIRNRSNGIAPPECYNVQLVTFSSSNPCGCVDSTSDGGDGQCLDLSFQQSNDECNLCGTGSNKAIGDTNRIIPTGGFFPGVDCGQLSTFSGAAFNDVTCPMAQSDAMTYCQCVASGDTVRECVAPDLDYLEDETYSACTADDICCRGFCQYRGESRGLVCSTKNILPLEEWPDWAITASGMNQNTYQTIASQQRINSSATTRNFSAMIATLLSSMLLLVFGM